MKFRGQRCDGIKIINSGPDEEQFWASPFRSKPTPQTNANHKSAILQ